VRGLSRLGFLRWNGRRTRQAVERGAKPPGQCSSASHFAPASISEVSAPQGSGILLSDISEVFRGEVGQESPVLCLGRAVPPEPTPFRPGQRVVTEGIFARQARPFQLRFPLPEQRGFVTLAELLGESARDAGDETEPVLQVV